LNHDDRSKRRDQIEQEQLHSIDPIETTNKDDRKYSPNRYVPEATNAIKATAAASALMRRNRYSTKAFFSKSVRWSPEF
jgi:hypothetical protein